MANPTRYTSGVNASPRNSTLSYLPQLADPAKLYAYHNDFTTYAAGDWTVTVIGSGSNALLTDEPFGALRSTNSGGATDGVQSQLVKANFTLVAGKQAWFKTRFKVSDASLSDLIIGLCGLDTTLLGATLGAGTTDGIFFTKDHGAVALDVQCQKDATTGQTRVANIATVVTDTYMTVGWHLSASGKVHVYVNDAHSTTIDSTGFFPDATLSVSFGLLNGEAVAKSMTVDYVYAAIER